MLVMRLLHSVLAAAVLLPGCASSPDIIPESLEPRVDKSLTFTQLQESPDSYKGRMVVIGGEVLKARRVQDGTQLEVLQLPLDDSHRPTSQRTGSQGRFLAHDASSLDPATIPENSPVTIVGEVTGATTQRLDESEYRYPTVDIKHLHVWEPNSEDERRASRPWWGIFGGVSIFGGGGRSGGGVGIGTGF